MSEQEPTGTTPEAAAAAATPPPKLHTVEQVQRIVSKETKILREQLAEAEQAKSELAALKEAAKTEQERAIENARKTEREEVTRTYEQRILRDRIDSALNLELVRRGIDPDLAPAIKAKQEIDDPKNVSAAIDAWAEGKEWLGKLKESPAPKTPGGSPSAGAGPKEPVDLRRASPADMKTMSLDELTEALNKRHG